jgi:hypothetical protein
MIEIKEDTDIIICDCSDAKLIKHKLKWSMDHKCIYCSIFREEMNLPALKESNELTINFVYNKDYRRKDYWE